MGTNYEENLQYWAELIASPMRDADAYTMAEFIARKLAEAWADGYNKSAVEEGFGPYPMERWLIRDQLVARGILPVDYPMEEFQYSEVTFMKTNRLHIFLSAFKRFLSYNVITIKKK